MSRAEALAHLKDGRPQAAAALLEAQLRLEPTDTQGWFLLGACRHALNDLPGAAAAFSRSLALDPVNCEAHLAHVSVLRAAGNSRSALAAAQQAVARFPGDARALYAAALCFEDTGQNDDALAHYDRALRAAPEFEDALHNKGLLLARLGRLNEAETNQRRYVAAFPYATRAHCALADVLLALGQFEETIEALDALERVERQDAGASVRRGVALAALRRIDEAREIFASALKRDRQSVMQYLQRIAPGSDPDLMLSPENIYLWRGWTALGQCSWSDWDGFVVEMRKAAQEPRIAVEPAVAFMCQHFPLSGAERHAIARHIAVAIETKFPALPPADAHGRPRLRIGVLSPDFREHLNAYLLLPFFELLDRTRFELYAYSLAADDGSAIRARVRSAVDGFRDLQGLTDRDAALAIRRDDIDILLDVGGHTTGSRFAITAQRPARLQASYLAFSGSLASRRIDYAIVDRVVGSNDAEWTEARIFLPDTYYLYDFRTQAPKLTLSRREYGLPDDAFVYCAFHKAEKITPDVFNMWAEILSRVPRSVLWFRALPEAASRNLRAQAVRRGIDPARLAFAQFEPSHDPRYLARHRLGDLMLDSLHHNAMTSACDALHAGLPVLTLRGSALASRTGESLLRAAGLRDLVASDRDAYVSTAVRFATDPTSLSGIKARLAANRLTSPLFDTAARVRALEAAFQGMYDRMMDGEVPASFDL